MEFREWLTGTTLKSSTVKKYAGVINGPISKWARDGGLVSGQLGPHISPEVFTGLAAEIRELPKFKVRDKRGKDMYGRALHYFARYLKEGVGRLPLAPTEPSPPDPGDATTSPQPPSAPLDLRATEGRLLVAMHRRRERRGWLPREKKRSVFNETGCLACEACDFDFAAADGDLGLGYAECHHRIPLGRLRGATETGLADLAIVCANCHRILHRRLAEGMTVEQLREYLEARQAGS